MPGVLLTHSNHLFSDRKQVEKMQPYPPLQTLIAASFLRDNGIAARMFDSTFTSADDEFEAAVRRANPDLIVVCEDDFNFLSKMCLAKNRELAFGMAECAQRLSIPIVTHGSDSSDNAGAFLNAGFAAVLIGEVEETLLELAMGKPWRDIHGLTYNSKGRIRRNPARSLRKNLDTLPLPAWDLIDIGMYRDAWKQAHGYFSLNMVSSRGCPYSCNWCAKPVYGNAYHARSPQVVASELRHLKMAYQPDHIWFADDIFGITSKWTREFAEAAAKMDAKIPFKMQSRCDLMTGENVKALESSGCREVWMGAESGSQKILDAMDKGIRISQIYEACENLRRYGIKACLFLQFGYPGEEWREIEETVRMVREVGPDDVGISVSYPLPGTKFHQIVSDQLGAKANWKDSADMAMMFRGAYSTEFYRALAKAVHAEVRGGETDTAWNKVYELRHLAAAKEEVVQCAYF